MPLLAKPTLSEASSANKAFMSLLKIRNSTACCFTRRGYIQTYEKEAEKVEGFLRSKQAKQSPDVTATIKRIWRHYENVALIFKRHSGDLICKEALITKFQHQYPAAAKSFDQNGALMQGSDGRKCLAPQLLVPIILRRAARELQEAQKMFLNSTKGTSSPARAVRPSRRIGGDGVPRQVELRCE